MTHRPTHLRAKPQGFVLLLTLVLLMLTAFAAVAMSRAAIDRVRSADEAQIQLQRRWATLSCQRFLLPQARVYLSAAAAKDQQSASVWRYQLHLGSANLQLLFGDESAKASANTLIKRFGRAQAALLIRRLCLGSPAAAGQVRLLSYDEHAPVGSLGQVFDGVTPEALFQDTFGSPPAMLLTCWGNGQLNFHEAKEEALRAICDGIVDSSQIEGLINLQQTNPNISLGLALNKIQVTGAHRRDVLQLLSDSSNCYSLWIDCEMAHRHYWIFSVIEPGPKIRVFEW